MNFVSIDVGDTPTYPPQVRAAFRFIEFANEPIGTCEDPTRRRKLTPAEQAVMRAALEVVRLYLTGEQAFAPDTPTTVRVGDTEPTGAPRPDGQQPPDSDSPNA